MTCFFLNNLHQVRSFNVKKLESQISIQLCNAMSKHLLMITWCDSLLQKKHLAVAINTDMTIFETFV